MYNSSKNHLYEKSRLNQQAPSSSSDLRPLQPSAECRWRNGETVGKLVRCDPKDNNGQHFQFIMDSEEPASELLFAEAKQDNKRFPLFSNSPRLANATTQNMNNPFKSLFATKETGDVSSERQLKKPTFAASSFLPPKILQAKEKPNPYLESLKEDVVVNEWEQPYNVEMSFNSCETNDVNFIEEYEQPFPDENFGWDSPTRVAPEKPVKNHPLTSSTYGSWLSKQETTHSEPLFDYEMTNETWSRTQEPTETIQPKRNTGVPIKVDQDERITCAYRPEQQLAITQPSNDHFNTTWQETMAMDTSGLKNANKKRPRSSNRQLADFEPDHQNVVSIDNGLFENNIGYDQQPMHQNSSVQNVYHQMQRQSVFVERPSYRDENETQLMNRLPQHTQQLPQREWESYSNSYVPRHHSGDYHEEAKSNNWTFNTYEPSLNSSNRPLMQTPQQLNLNFDLNQMLHNRNFQNPPPNRKRMNRQHNKRRKMQNSSFHQ